MSMWVYWMKYGISDVMGGGTKKVDVGFGWLKVNNLPYARWNIINQNGEN